MIGFFLCHKIIIILLFLLVRVFSFLSLYVVNDNFLIVITASEVGKVETIEKIKNDVRKNTRQKKIMLVGFFCWLSATRHQFLRVLLPGGSVAKV